MYKEMKKDSEVIDALAKVAKLKESHPSMGQRRGNVKGWKKFKKQVKRRSTINEPVRQAQSPASSPTSSPATTRAHRSNSLGKKVAITVSHDKQATDNKPPIKSPVREPGKEKPVDKSPEDMFISHQGSIGSSTSLSVQHSGSVDHEEDDYTSMPSPPIHQQPVTIDNGHSKQEDHDDNVDVELIPQPAEDTKERITVQEALDTLMDTTCIYSNDFGNREHQEEMMRLFKMLEGDHLDLGPTDPSVLEDLNGWRLAPKENA